MEKSYSVTITTSGQITLPKEIRDELSVSAGDKVIIRDSKDKISIEKKLSGKEIAEELDRRKTSNLKAKIRKYGGKENLNLSDNAAFVDQLKEEYGF